MSRIKIRMGDDPVLKQVCEEIKPGNHERLMADMRKACAKNKGVGLAASQIGVPLRAFVWCVDSGKGARYQYVFNPEILESSKETDVKEEGCLSYPGIWKKIRRPSQVRVRYQTPDFQTVNKWINGYSARVFQHEYDHTIGVCLVGDPRYPDGGPPQESEVAAEADRKVAKAAGMNTLLVTSMVAAAMMGSFRGRR